MPSFRRPRPPEQPSSHRASTSASQSSRRTQPASAPPQGIPQHGPPAEKDARLAQMKELAWGALEMVQTASSLAAEATADVAVPGLSIALSALSEILNKILMMKTTVDGVATLVKHVATLTAKLTAFCERPRQRQLPEDMLARINELVATWTSIEERARKIKSAGAIKRFFTSDADAKKLEGLVAEISSSIHDDFLLEQILSIEENVHVIREDVEIIREDVGIVLEETGSRPSLSRPSGSTSTSIGACNTRANDHKTRGDLLYVIGGKRSCLGYKTPQVAFYGDRLAGAASPVR